MSKRDKELTNYVADELSLEPRVNATAIAVSAENGTVTLRGTVGTFREKREAEKAAKRVHGVELVDNDLQVTPLLNDSVRGDADLRGDVLQALALDDLVPKTVGATAEGGRVTLTGIADWQYQRDEAEFVASNIVGALHVVDEIALTPKPDEGDVKKKITRAFERSAKLDADHLSVKVSKDTVTIKGAVSSWTEHDDAMAAAWSAPGVLRVVDHLTIRH